MEEAPRRFAIPLQGADAEVDDVRVHESERALDVWNWVKLVGEEVDFGQRIAYRCEGLGDFAG